MNKQELLEKLRSQPDCFFSLQQTIKLVEEIDDYGPQETIEEIPKATLINGLISAISKKLESNNKKAIIDPDKSVFAIYNNKVFLEDYEINTTLLNFEVRTAVVEFFEDLKVKFVKPEEQEVEYVAGDGYQETQEESN